MPTRLAFTVPDLMRVRVAPSLGPLAETALAYSRLASPTTPTLTQHTTRHLVRQATLSDRALASYLWLSPTAGLDLFTVGGHSSSFAAGEESLLEAPDDIWMTEVEGWAATRTEARRRGLLARATSGHADVETALRRGSVDSWRPLLAQMQDRYRTWIGPTWPMIRDRLSAEEARLAHATATGGLEGLAAALEPSIRWTGLNLDIPDTGISGTHTWLVRLGGRGLTIVPSFFALRPMAFAPAASSDPVLLIVPCGSSATPAVRDRSRASRGAELLGRTRAAVLRRVAQKPCTTSQLSHDLGIALSGASQHASVLRRAGLITTIRDGGHVQHQITELGEQLLAHW